RLHEVYESTPHRLASNVHIVIAACLLLPCQEPDVKVRQGDDRNNIVSRYGSLGHPRHVIIEGSADRIRQRRIVGAVSGLDPLLNGASVPVHKGRNTLYNMPFRNPERLAAFWLLRNVISVRAAADARNLEPLHDR